MHRVENIMRILRTELIDPSSALGWRGFDRQWDMYRPQRAPYRKFTRAWFSKFNPCAFGVA